MKVAPGTLGEPANAPLLGAPLWDTITKISGPAVIFISATCYLSGHVGRQIVYNSIGIKDNIVTHTVQDTIADGFPGVLLTLIIITFFIGIPTLFVIRMSQKHPDASVRFVLIVTSVKELARYFHMMNAAIGMLFIGIAGGSLTAYTEIRELNKVSSSKCQESCFQYVLRDGQVYGRVVAQGPDRTAILSPKAVYILKTEDIKYVRPVGDSRDEIRRKAHFPFFPFF
ncbi:hypothetical protein BH11PSE6_BH11PSE6_03330 [soil metagenome]